MDGGSGEGGLTVSCQDCVCEGSGRADNSLKTGKPLRERKHCNKTRVSNLQKHPPSALMHAVPST